MQFKLLALITFAATAFAVEHAAVTADAIDVEDACMTAWQNSGAMEKGATEETKNKAGCDLKKCWGGQNWDQKTQDAVEDAHVDMIEGLTSGSRSIGRRLEMVVWS
ncbi:hypothetical protein AC578_9151 [Pseudocercospora eumusae]|uniref:Uncharacterized protein n=1 Tax=Pseudocercospora eumusae TaxID=321146 RepID=A0A139HUX7_9PEZI|nr:hypothetical protein AC578_9151 [Pseudocercospora eumusae]KXT06271.1 hypothetical protein AC578_9151 [Pseudocercospora eumusae]